MSNLSDLLQRAVAWYSALSPAEKALHDDDQRRSMVKGETGRDPGPHPLAAEVRRLRHELKRKAGDLTNREADRLQRLRRRAYHLQNNINSRPNYNMDHSHAELSALCWAIERITGEPFHPDAPFAAGVRQP